MYKIPEGYTEQQVLDIINSVLNTISNKHQFDIYNSDDIKQEGFIIAIDILNNYDGSIPLENFMSICLGYRLTNFKRDNYLRLNRPCSKCKIFDENCFRCLKRQQTQEKKKNLLNPVDIELINDKQVKYYDNNFLDTLEMVELVDKINKELPVEYREDYLKIKDGLYVPKDKRLEIEQIIQEIIQENE